MEFEKEINEIIKLDKNKFKTKEEYFKFALKEIEKHISILKELNKNKDKKLPLEIIDLHVWSKILLEENEITDKEILSRINYFKEKLFRGNK